MWLDLPKSEMHAHHSKALFNITQKLCWCTNITVCAYTTANSSPVWRFFLGPVRCTWALGQFSNDHGTWLEITTQLFCEISHWFSYILWYISRAQKSFNWDHMAVFSLDGSRSPIFHGSLTTDPPSLYTVVEKLSKMVGNSASGPLYSWFTKREFDCLWICGGLYASSLIGVIELNIWE